MADSSSSAPKRKLRPARKQVAPGEIDKSEGPQAGKEYSEQKRLAPQTNTEVCLL